MTFVKQSQRSKVLLQSFALTKPSSTNHLVLNSFQLMRSLVNTLDAKKFKAILVSIQGRKE